jgi:hypothetical protein
MRLNKLVTISSPHRQTRAFSLSLSLKHSLTLSLFLSLQDFVDRRAAREREAVASSQSMPDASCFAVVVDPRLVEVSAFLALLLLLLPLLLCLVLCDHGADRSLLLVFAFRARCCYCCCCRCCCVLCSVTMEQIGRSCVPCTVLLLLLLLCFLLCADQSLFVPCAGVVAVSCDHGANQTFLLVFLFRARLCRVLCADVLVLCFVRGVAAAA